MRGFATDPVQSLVVGLTRMEFSQLWWVYDAQFSVSDVNSSVGSQSKRFQVTRRRRTGGYEDRRFVMCPGGRRRNCCQAQDAMAEAERESLAFDFPDDLRFFE